MKREVVASQNSLEEIAKDKISIRMWEEVASLKEVEEAAETLACMEVTRIGTPTEWVMEAVPSSIVVTHSHKRRINPSSTVKVATAMPTTVG